MIDFSGSSQSQGGDSQDDPTQKMIRQALASVKSQPQQPTPGTFGPNGHYAMDEPGTPQAAAAAAAGMPTDRASFGEKIGAKTPPTTPRPAVEQPVSVRVVTQPRPSITPPGATGVLVPVARDSTPSTSFGQKIGAKTAVQPEASPAPTAPSISSIIPQSAPPAALTAGLDRKPVPTAPVGSNNPNLTSALAEQQKFATPLDRGAIDPKTGKPMYKMGWGQRLLGIAANFASGMDGGRVVGDDGSEGADRRRGGGPVVYVGPGATNRRYDIDEATRQANLEKANLNVAGQEKLDTSNLNLEKLAQRQAYESDMGASRKETAEARMATAAAQQETADTKDQLAQAKIAQGPQEPKTESEIALAKQMAILKGDKQKAAVYDGALKELAKQKLAGREPKDTTAADIAKAIQVSEYRGRERDKIDKLKEEERNKRYAEIDKDVKVKYNPQKVADAKAQADQALETKYADKYKTVNDQADQMLGLTKAGANLKSQPTTQAPPKPTAPAPAGKVWVYERKTGKRGTIPAAQLDKATKGANAQYGVW